MCWRQAHCAARGARTWSALKLCFWHICTHIGACWPHLGGFDVVRCSRYRLVVGCMHSRSGVAFFVVDVARLVRRRRNCTWLRMIILVGVWGQPNSARDSTSVYYKVLLVRCVSGTPSTRPTMRYPCTVCLHTSALALPTPHAVCTDHTYMCTASCSGLFHLIIADKDGLLPCGNRCVDAHLQLSRGALGL